jgi:predicted ribosome quality control (RQC) complex YloA/Tae2 family protein
VSNSIVYDPLLVRHLADELHSRVAGRSCRAAPRWDAAGLVILELDGDEALQADLHPSRGWIRLVPQRAPEPAGEGRITRVHAMHDERILVLEIEAGGRFRGVQRRVTFELLTNQWNAIVTESVDRRIVSVLRPRTTGSRILRAGEAYRAPPAHSRIHPATHTLAEAREAWAAVIASSPPAERVRRIIREFSYTGAINTPALVLRDHSAGGELEGFDRWWEMVTRREADPVLLRLPTGPQPYPFPLPGIPSERAASLLQAMDEAASEGRPEVGAPDVQALAAALEERAAAAARRADRIRGELRREEDEVRSRGYGDLLLANLGAVPRGASRVRLPDWDGREVEIPLDPSLSPAENAARHYDTARRRQRARERLPALVAAATAERDRWLERLDSLRTTGQADESTLEALRRTKPSSGRRRSVDEERLPYRSYRTSGGLEIRLGRGSTDNDRLTFGNSHPDDIWLHARSVTGSHVILRWRDADQQPPQRDLLEAAGLAAWFSKARSSGLVPVDWTRRKHVRKPRGAPPGAVIPSRVKTVFVEPDPDLAERLEEGDGGR